MITVLGAGGNTGGRAVRRLREAGETVRAVGRDPGRLADAAAHGAEPYAADITDRAALAAALRGADAAYVLMPLDVTAPDYRAQQEQVGTAIAGALADAGVPHVVALSALGAELPTGTGFLETLHEQEQRLAALDVSVVLLRPGLFFESFLPSLPAMLATGVHHDTIDPDVALPMIATADVGDAAAAALREPGAAGVRELPGPEELTVPDAVARLGAAIGRPGLRYERPPEDVMRAVLVEAGLPADLTEEQLAMNAAFNRGDVRRHADHGPATPTTIEEWARASVPVA